MGFVVTGISQHADVSALQTALRGAGLAVDPLDVIEPDGVIVPTSAPGIASSNVGPIETGTGVPGLTSGRGPTIGGSGYLRDDSPLGDLLSDYGIPDDELANYLDALHAGRFVVAYRATAETVEAVERAFAAAGLAKVKRF
jgi:hypothetical protein